MKRLPWLAAGLALVAAGLWLAGRAPSRYVLERECAAYHEQRRSRYQLVTLDIGRAQADKDPGVAALTRERDELLRETKRITIRGWEVLLVPAGAPRPAPGDFVVAGRFDASEPRDPAPLRGGIEAWIAPRGRLARLFARGGA
jgi:hypothetical protein